MYVISLMVELIHKPHSPLALQHFFGIPAVPPDIEDWISLPVNLEYYYSSLEHYLSLFYNSTHTEIQWLGTELNS